MKSYLHYHEIIPTLPWNHTYTTMKSYPRHTMKSYQWNAFIPFIKKKDRKFTIIKLEKKDFFFTYMLLLNFSVKDYDQSCGVGRFKKSDCKVCMKEKKSSWNDFMVTECRNLLMTFLIYIYDFWKNKRINYDTFILTAGKWEVWLLTITPYRLLQSPRQTS